MSDLERALLRFKANWNMAFPDTTPPESVEDIVAWYKANHERYKCVRFIPGWGWMEYLGERLSDEKGMEQYRFNLVIDEACNIEIMTRKPVDDGEYW